MTRHWPILVNSGSIEIRRLVSFLWVDASIEYVGDWWDSGRSLSKWATLEEETVDPVNNVYDDGVDKRKMEWMACNGNDLDSYSPISLIIASVVATKNLQP